MRLTRTCSHRSKSLPDEDASSRAYLPPLGFLTRPTNLTAPTDGRRAADLSGFGAERHQPWA